MSLEKQLLNIQGFMLGLGLETPTQNPKTAFT